MENGSELKIKVELARSLIEPFVYEANVQSPILAQQMVERFEGSSISRSVYNMELEVCVGVCVEGRGGGEDVS